MNKDITDRLAPFGWVEHRKLDENGKEVCFALTVAI